jgi:peptidylamidoglycolate lyase
MDSQGRIFVADRGNSRIQVFDSNGKFVTEWKRRETVPQRPHQIKCSKTDGSFRE